MPRVPSVTNATRAMSNSSLEFFYMDRNYSGHDANFKNKCPARGRAFQFSEAKYDCSTIFSSCSTHPATVGSIACKAHRNAHAAADAQRGEALLGVALLHLVQQGHQHPRTGGAD